MSLSLILLCGCTTSNLRSVDHAVDLGQHKKHWLNKRSKLEYMSCNHGYYDWMSDKQFDAARDYFVFSIMASNVYRDLNSPYYVIPDWKLIDRRESDSGLTIDVYKSLVFPRFSVVYRGTDFKEKNDWATNFAIVNPNQYREAYQHLKGFVADKSQAEIYVTGHSLGGGIALNMAQRIEGVSAVAFNSSPRAFFRPDSSIRNPMVHIYETGEILGPLNRSWLRLRAPRIDPVKFNYLDFLWWTVSPLREHSMYLLSRGLLLTAIEAESEEAKRTFVSNVERAEAVAVEWEQCRNLYDESR